MALQYRGTQEALTTTLAVANKRWKTIDSAVGRLTAVIDSSRDKNGRTLKDATGIGTEDFAVLRDALDEVKARIEAARDRADRAASITRYQNEIFGKLESLQSRMITARNKFMAHVEQTAPRTLAGFPEILGYLKIYDDTAQSLMGNMPSEDAAVRTATHNENLADFDPSSTSWTEWKKVYLSRLPTIKDFTHDNVIPYAESTLKDDWESTFREYYMKDPADFSRGFFYPNVVEEFARFTLNAKISDIAKDIFEPGDDLSVHLGQEIPRFVRHVCSTDNSTGVARNVYKVVDALAEDMAGDPV